MPAPGPLALVQAFLNTADLEAGEDLLSSPVRARAWLAERGFARRGRDRAIDETDRARLVAVREALRGVLAAREAGIAASDADLRVLADAAERAPLVARVTTAGSVELQARGGGADAVVAAVLGAIAAAGAQGTWERLKVCHNDTCRWAFYDASRNHSGHWCSMAVCGNRMKGREFRRRRSTPTGL